MDTHYKITASCGSLGIDWSPALLELLIVALLRFHHHHCLLLHYRLGSNNFVKQLNKETIDPIFDYDLV
jgi:hypothetical protein